MFIVDRLFCPSDINAVASSDVVASPTPIDPNSHTYIVLQKTTQRWLTDGAEAAAPCRKGRIMGVAE